MRMQCRVQAWDNQKGGMRQHWRPWGCKHLTKELQTQEMCKTGIRGNKVNKKQVSNRCKALHTANLGVMWRCSLMKKTQVLKHLRKKI